jgi:hypothetical protein
MPVGLNADLTKRTVDQQLGIIAQNLNVAFASVEELTIFLAGALDADLEALGYTPEEIPLVRSAAADMEQLRLIYLGEEDLPAAKDFRAFMRRVWGTGFRPL